ncbi:SPI-2 type III secretion system protein SpiA [Salmonella enterica subsp. enterica serovar Oslo]|nr:SPI-2 type III secretion system protein SpiA [Salmonella enterica]EBB8079071.1 SPI-2 type III secretion system protein SpiA [Salmonella enterica subsp. enterica serovar Oslo]EAN4767508.1 SPI-2 type III secretion system protein SpiA [Salmonella enterica]EAS5030821.1 SPI-2 type III secretion system protein SpiA [Salmonella enterica]EAS5666585.1 SPI-2 type III secretion system protein SpiA [Salmonella enterica]
MVVNKRLILILLFILNTAKSDELSWKGNDFTLYARQMPLAEVLHLLSENYDTAITISPLITATFSGKIPPGPPVDILNKLAAQYDLLTWFDGSMLYVYPASLLKHQVITFNILSTGRFIHYLRSQNILSSPGCEVKEITGTKAVEVSGVPSCLTRISQLASVLDNALIKRKDSAVSVSIYTLKYATAMDTQYQYRDQSVVVPGVVSVLREMSKTSVPASSTNNGSPATQALPMFAADPRQNAVIVRDYAANMAGYRKLITELDQRQQMIEISVKIIDVNAGDINQLGIDWGTAVSLGGKKIAFNTGLNDGGASGFSTVISDTSNFMVRLNALEKSSQAYVLSQPSVVTLNNIQAVLDKNITFYTKLQGEKVAKLESITTGSLLRVTPRLLNDNGTQKIMLNLNIQDGQQSDTQSETDPLPEVQNSEIASQATLLAGQSLLLGGFKQGKQIHSQNKIPLLGDIPVVGHLFRNDTTQVHSVIRLFLIKASVVNNGISHG